MSSSFFDTLAPEYIRSLPVYQPGKQVEALQREMGVANALKIASNENPLGPSPKAVEAARAALAEAHLYPDSVAYKLRHALAEKEGVEPDNLFFGEGSNEIIHMLVHAFCRPGADEVLTHRHAFISYRLAAMSMGVHFVEAPITPELSCDVDALIAAMSPRTKLIFLANPNNPTGSHVTRAALERVLEAAPQRALVVVDEAYHEYAIAAMDDYPRSQAYHSPERPQLLTLRTFSKIYGLAGVRAGYAVGDARVLAILERIRRPFNLNLVAQAAALAALDDTAHLEASRAVAQRGIEHITAAASSLGLRAYPSVGNFVLVHAGEDADQVYQTLLGCGVIVRGMGVWGLPEHLRVSVPPSEHLPRVTTALRQAFGKE